MTNTYSTKSNALRAARKAGLDPEALIFTPTPAGDGWTFAQKVADKPAAEEAAASARTIAAEAALTEYLAADERGEGWMLALFGRVFDAGAATVPTRRSAARKPREGGPSKRDMAAQLLLRPEGTTAREILDATGWPAVSVPAIAKASKLNLRQEKDGKVTRYYGEAA